MESFAHLTGNLFRIINVKPIKLFEEFEDNANVRIFRSLNVSAIDCRRPGIIYPHAVSWMWKYEQYYNKDEYTVDPLHLVKTGGRGPDGRVQHKHVGGGLKMPFYMVDYNRSRQLMKKEIHEEKILRIFKSWYRHPYLALVANGNTKRWIIATSTMNVGDVIKSHYEIPKIPVDPIPGHAYPIGALPVGTKICLIELIPGEGAIICRTAGTSASLTRRGFKIGSTPFTTSSETKPAKSRFDIIDEEEICVVHETNRRQEYKLLPQCVVVVGQVSNVDRNKFKYESFQEKKMYGIRQRSGHYQKKTGRFGKKNRAKPPTLDYTSAQEPLQTINMLYTNQGTPLQTVRKKSELYKLMNRMEHGKINPTPRPFNEDSEHKQPKFRW